MESEGGAGGLTYRHVYGLEKVETVISGIANGAGSILQYIVSDETGELVLTSTDPGKDVIKNGIVKLYSHHDHLGTTDYLTDNVSGKVVSYVSYDDWGALTAKAVLKMGARELDLVQDYTGHPYDSVLDIYYAKARMYDAADRRFMAVDIIKGTIADPQSLVQYTYCLDNPIKFVDLLGLLTNVDLVAWDRAEMASYAASDERALLASAAPAAAPTYADIVYTQQRLNQLGYFGKDGKPLAVDGSLGPNTTFAVKAFQKDQGISVDGSPGPITRLRLNKEAVDREILGRITAPPVTIVPMGTTAILMPKDYFPKRHCESKVDAAFHKIVTSDDVKAIMAQYDIHVRMQAGSFIPVAGMGCVLVDAIVYVAEGDFEAAKKALGQELIAQAVGFGAGYVILKVGAKIGSRFIKVAVEKEVEITNDIIGKPRVGSALKVDDIKPTYAVDTNGRTYIVQEFPSAPQAHGFTDIVDNYAGYATSKELGNGAVLYQVEGSLSGVAGRFEWITQNGNVTHRMFVQGGTVNGVPIKQ